MSNQSDPISNLLNIQTIQEIDHLDLPIMQKHHVRILAHCLQIFKIILSEKSSESNYEILLRQWCDNQSQKFGDEQFSNLFYDQLELTVKKLNTFSKSIDKNIGDLEIDDLVLLVKQS